MSRVGHATRIPFRGSAAAPFACGGACDLDTPTPRATRSPADPRRREAARPRTETGHGTYGGSRQVRCAGCSITGSMFHVKHRVYPDAPAVRATRSPGFHAGSARGDSRSSSSGTAAYRDPAPFLPISIRPHRGLLDHRASRGESRRVRGISARWRARRGSARPGGLRRAPRGARCSAGTCAAASRRCRSPHPRSRPSAGSAHHRRARAAR